MDKKPVPALMDAMNTMRDTVEKGWGVPQRFSATMREIWQFQPQFDNMRGARPYRLLSQARFRAAYDFLILRSEVGEVDKEMASWWTTFQHADEETRQQMTAANDHPNVRNKVDQLMANPNVVAAVRKRKPLRLNKLSKLV